MPADAVRSVLVVDDDERFATTLAQALTRRGWNARVAHDVASALDAVEAEAPGAAIVDLRLADEDGLALLAPLRSAHPQMRIIVLTGYASIATAVKAIKLGADDYLAKPLLRAPWRTRSAAARTSARFARPRRPRNRCPRAVSSGSTSSACSRRTTATCRQRLARCGCIAAHSSASSRSAQLNRERGNCEQCDGSGRLERRPPFRRAARIAQV
jgi:DNA-binding NtrC family response regulator